MANRALICSVVLALAGAGAAAHACGDKLATIGGGVSFERVSGASLHGRVVLLLAPDSSLSVADVELNLTDTLRRAGHSVRRVTSEAELEASLARESADVVVVDWSDENEVSRRLVSNASSAPAVIPVIYKATAAQMSDATAKSGCVVTQAEKRRGRQLTETVDRALAKRKSGQTLDCSIVAAADRPI